MGELGMAYEAAQVGVSSLILCQEYKMITSLSFGKPFDGLRTSLRTLPFGGPFDRLRTRLRAMQGKLGPDDRLYPPLPGSPIETNYSIEPIVIGDGQAVHAQCFSLIEEIFRVRGPVQ